MIFIQYLLHNNKIFVYIEYILYKLDKIKIAFENHCFIDAKLFRPTFYYSKFYATTYFIKCIWNYKSAINNDIIHSKATYKYFFKIFY